MHVACMQASMRNQEETKPTEQRETIVCETQHGAVLSMQNAGTC